MKAIGVIPARFGSVRLKGKPLIEIDGKPMIQHVYERAMKSKLLNEILVATDDMRIYDTVLNFGGNAVMTKKSHTSGTERAAEAIKNIECEIAVNIQGDEPLIHPNNIDKAIEALLENKQINVSTLAYKIKSKREIEDPNVVKLVIDKNQNAIYFSRYAIPFNRDNIKLYYYKHIGLYAFRKKYLLELAKQKRTLLERAEKLEQLRILENGEKIKAVITKIDSYSADTKEDLEKIKKYIKRKK